MEGVFLKMNTLEVNIFFKIFIGFLRNECYLIAFLEKIDHKIERNNIPKTKDNEKMDDK